jgi:Na+/melibiose symporter-like transporter
LNKLKTKKIKDETMLPRKEVWFLSGGMFGQAFISSFMGAFLFLFYNRIGIPPWVVGLVLGVARVWDGFNDPIIGAMIDRRKPGKNGKLRPLILNTAIPIGIVTILLFFLPQQANIYIKCAWILVFYLGWDVLYTIHDISKWGLAARMSPLTNDRSKVISRGKILWEVGLVFPQIVLLMIDEGNMKKISAFTGLNLTFENVIQSSALVFAVAGGLVMGMSYLAKERVTTSNPPQSLAKDIKIIFQNKTLLLLLASTLLGTTVLNLGSDYYFFATMDVGFDFFGNTIRGTNAMAIYGVVISVPAALGMFFANMLGKRIGMKNILLWACISPIFFRFIAFFVGYQGQRFLLVMLLMSLSTIPRGMHGIAYMSIVTDSIDYVEWKTGRRTEGTTFAMNTLIGKIGGGLSTMMAGLTLTLLKFSPEPVNGVVIAGELFTKWVWPLFMLGPVLSGIISIVPVFMIDFTGRKKEQIQAELKERRALVEAQQAKDTIDAMN